IADVAEAVINHKADPVDSLSGAILILPLPSRQCEGKQQPAHPRFAPSQDQQGAPPKNPKKDQKGASKMAVQSKRSSVDAQSSDPAPAEPMSYFYFELTDRTQDEVLDDLEIYRTAARKGSQSTSWRTPGRVL
ncbi:hypothetical protein JG688_00008470, partial [Phytophthora aleatoria]